MEQGKTIDIESETRLFSNCWKFVSTIRSDYPSFVLLDTKWETSEHSNQKHEEASEANIITPPKPKFSLNEKAEESGPVKYFSATFEIKQNTSLYGAGEVAHRLLLNGRKIICRNSDAVLYDSSFPSLYQSHPWILAVNEDGSSFGVIADCSFKLEIDLDGKIKFSSFPESKVLVPFPVFVITGHSPQEVVASLSKLTGYMSLPPKYSVGYHQCRWSYYPDDRVREIAHEFRKRQIPCDVIWMDIHYMDGYRIFTFDPKLFPEPSKLNSDLHNIGFKAVWMIDPGVKVDPDYFVYQEGSAGNHWILDKNNQPYVGDVWPGPCVFPDFTLQSVRDWWASLYKQFMAMGVDGVWNDMNEPSVFNSPTKTMPVDNIHRGYSEKGYGQSVSNSLHEQFHNVYGMLMVKASRDGIQKATPDKRVFILTRSGFLGYQRYAATWTGDNTSNYHHLQLSIPMTLNLSLSGQPFAGPDIGGFSRNADAKLFGKWMASCSLLPFCRGHTETGSNDHEPWAFGEECELKCRLALKRRYAFLPHIYTQFYLSSINGLGIVQPIFFADPKDMRLRDEDRGYLLGDSILVACDVQDEDQKVEEGKEKVNLPQNQKWKKIEVDDENEKKEIIDGLPTLYQADGSIVVLSTSGRQHVGDHPDKEKGYEVMYADHELLLNVVLMEKKEAVGYLYEDDGQSLAYQRGDFVFFTFKATLLEEEVKVQVVNTTGNMTSRCSLKVKVKVHCHQQIVTGEGSLDSPITIRIKK